MRAIESISGGDSTVTITLILGIFAVAHSGLASVRPKVWLSSKQLWTRSLQVIVSRLSRAGLGAVGSAVGLDSFSANRRGFYRARGQVYSS